MGKSWTINLGEMPAFEELSTRYRKKALRRMAQVLKVAMRAEAPDSGNSHADMAMGTKGKLKKSFRYDTPKGGYDVLVGTRARHAHLVEYGTRAHLTPAVNRKAVKWDSGGEMRIAKSAPHPGARANPFMDRAYQKALPDVMDRLKKSVEESWAEIAAGERGEG